MSTIDLIVLGCVAKQPRSAYDIQKDVEEHNLTEWTRISIPSIYKKVLRLKEEGYMESEEPEGDRFSNKTMYRITDKGIRYMESLMYECSVQKPRIIMDFNSVICNLNKVDEKTALTLIKNIENGIIEAKQFYRTSSEDHADIPLVGKTIMEQQEKVCDTLLEWVQDLYIRYKKEMKR